MTTPNTICALRHEPPTHYRRHAFDSFGVAVDTSCPADPFAEMSGIYRKLVEHSLVGTFVVEAGHLLYANKLAAQILGYDPADHTGLAISELVIGSDRPMVEAELAEVAAGRLAVGSIEFHIHRTDAPQAIIGAKLSRMVYEGRPAVMGVLTDITERRLTEERAQQYLASLELAVMNTVRMAMQLVEFRDPYTNGHERRVAEIAVAIGREIGLDDERLKGLRVAGFLHDVGKVTVPIEILVKTGRLTPLEFQMIQGHAQAGYDVLNHVAFPWPVAEAARQHHERMDGSGYPRGLSGEEILLEARVLAVADVVEAMTSHRPYRPALGLEPALTEITRGRGTAYDAQVADACLCLFRDKGLVLPG